MMKKFLTLLYDLREKINQVDCEFRYNFNKNDFRCNPFLSTNKNTYIWVEKVKNKL